MGKNKTLVEDVGPVLSDAAGIKWSDSAVDKTLFAVMVECDWPSAENVPTSQKQQAFEGQ